VSPKILSTAALAAALILSATVADARRGNVEAGRELAKTCQACHGADGNGIGDGQYPNIAGQYEDYLLHSLKAYKSGDRNNAIMAGFVAGLDEQNMADLAAFFAAQKGPLSDLREMK
jgi:cytochrome c553